MVDTHTYTGRSRAPFLWFTVVARVFVVRRYQVKELVELGFEAITGWFLQVVGSLELAWFEVTYAKFVRVVDMIGYSIGAAEANRGFLAWLVHQRDAFRCIRLVLPLPVVSAQTGHLKSSSG